MYCDRRVSRLCMLTNVVFQRNSLSTFFQKFEIVCQTDKIKSNIYTDFFSFRQISATWPSQINHCFVWLRLIKGILILPNVENILTMVSLYWACYVMTIQTKLLMWKFYVCIYLPNVRIYISIKHFYVSKIPLTWFIRMSIPFYTGNNSTNQNRLL